jgi:hypothetical protein
MTTCRADSSRSWVYIAIIYIELPNYLDEPVSGGAATGKSEPAATHSPFANLKDLFC